MYVLIWKFMTEYGFCTEDYTLSSQREEFKQKKCVLITQQGKQSTPSHNLQATKMSLMSMNNGQSQVSCQLSKKSWLKNLKKENSKNIQKSLKQLGKKTRQQFTKKQKNLQLDQEEFKKKVQNYRISNLIKEFTQKLKRTSISKTPIIYNPFQSVSYQSGDCDGIQLSEIVLLLFTSISSVLTFANCLLSTFLIIFQSTQWFQGVIFPFSFVNICWIIFETIFGFVMVREQGNNKLQKIKQISRYYIKNQLLLNLLYLTCTIISSLAMVPLHQIPNILTLIKIPEALRKSKIVQSKLINIFYEQQYWNLFKMFLYNFIFAHIVAIVLFLMAELGDGNNWMKNKNIVDCTQFQKYSWAYYWATTIILSVGFGDIVAANPKEAIILVVVEIVGCMALAYNINRIGNMLQDMQEKQSQKQKRLKLLKQMCSRNQIQKNIQFKLTNYINQSYKINEKFNFDESIKLVSKLPSTLQQEFKRSSNKKILHKIGFLRNFTNKSVLRIAQKLQEKMLHPWQTLFNPQECKDIVILQQGSIGLCANFGITKFNQIVIEEFKVKDRQNSLLVSLDFVRPYQVPKNYDYKAIRYSIIGSISYNQFIQILKLKNVDSEYFYTLRDKQRKSNQYFELLACQECHSNHSKFTCPRLHYSPIGQQVIYKNLLFQKNSKVPRAFKKRFKQPTSALKFHGLFEIELNSEQSIQESNQQKLTSQKLKTKRCIQRKYPNMCDSVIMGMVNQRDSWISRGRTKVLIKNSLGQTKIDFSKSQRGLKNFNSFNAFDVWTVQSDKINDYKFYFPQFNAKQLENSNVKYKVSTNKKMSKSIKIKSTLNKKTVSSQ